MSKKLVIISAVVVVLILGGAGGYFIFSQKNTNSPDSDQVPSSNFLQIPGKTDESLISYQDTSGFSFDYPRTISIKDITPAAGIYYTELELSKAGQSLKISITDGNTNPYKNDKNARLIGSTTLGGINSNQYVVKDRLVSVAIDQGVLYVIDGPKDGGFWEDTQNSILTSFKFGTSSAASGAAAADANTTYEEEVVE